MSQAMTFSPRPRARLFGTLLILIGLFSLIFAWWNLAHAMGTQDFSRTTGFFMRGLAAITAASTCTVWLWIHARALRPVSVVYAVLLLPALWEYTAWARMLFLHK